VTIVARDESAWSALSKGLLYTPRREIEITKAGRAKELQNSHHMLESAGPR